MPGRLVTRGILLLCFLWLGGCGAHVYHVVQPEETLHSIGFQYGEDFREIAKWNDIDPPYVIRVGQHIRVVPPHGQESRSERIAKVDPAPQQVPREPEPARATAVLIEWSWPIDGVDNRSGVSWKAARKGLDFEAGSGEPVRAAAAGRVVYAGAGIPHYGNLLIIKHDEQYLSAYAHNRRLLVDENDEVEAGQQIAEMGDSGTGADRIKLHFEIRLDGTPVDPLRYLP